jgi:hypothetical protein
MYVWPSQQPERGSEVRCVGPFGLWQRAVEQASANAVDFRVGREMQHD